MLYKLLQVQIQAAIA